ncbi:DEAD/DEAH box helicase [Candidatus Woesearchaeota archaeon]|nr:DEAD/DEAH box helicase [Candidatus Woesearchaeota archaeon]
MTLAVPSAIAISGARDNHFITEYLTEEVMLKDFEPRIYQQTILAKCIEKNVLVVLPTGLGKTSIALMLAVHRFRQFPNSKILFLAPTKPLVDQHHATFLRYLDNVEEASMVVFTGTVRPEKREQLWRDARIIFATPQGIENDLVSRRVGLENVSLLIVDEAHRAVGDYSYTFLVQRYCATAAFPKVLGLTASPGSDIEKITEVCQNLSIEDVEIRTDQDPDVRPYIQDVKLTWHSVQFPPELDAIRKKLQACYHSKLNDICARGYLQKDKIASLGRVGLLGLQAQLHGSISHGEKAYDMLKCISLAAEAMKVQHALELLETQSLRTLNLYLQKLQQEALTSKVKAVQNLVQDHHFKAAVLLTSTALENNIEHAKLEELKKAISSELQPEKVQSVQSNQEPLPRLIPQKRIIIFNQFREMGVQIVDMLSKLPGATPRLFVGQAKKGMTGLSQKQQREMLDDFRNGAFNILVATSVAEEGIDIPAVDAVFFYEPIPSAIRHIQRRGRTGRLEKGKVIIFVTKGTRDEGYRWSAHHKEQRMYRNLDELKRTFHHLKSREENKLDKYLLPGIVSDKEIFIFIDDREKNNGVIRTLVELGAKIQLKRLTVGDYVVGKSCVVELKTVKDFVDSIIDGRLLQQIKELKQYYQRPVIIVEGDEDIYSQRNIHPNAVRGMIAAITVSYGIPLISTKTPKDTAQMLAVIAKREQENEDHAYAAHHKKPLTLEEQQEYLIAALPGIGPKLAKPLLAKFGSIKNIVNANLEDLQQIEMIGEKKAREIQNVLGRQAP